MATKTTIKQFETTIIRIRDILRREGITGMDSMKHCTLYIAARYLTTERLKQLGIPETFGWEAILALSRTGLNDGEKAKNRQLSRDRIYNAGGECLVHHFDDLFKTTEFSFRVGPNGHGDILEALAPIQMEDIELEKDLLGWVYEQHLSKGASSARDLGQYFTDRTITQYMTKICDPKRLADGSLEYVCDPSMGTGGFLTSAVQHLRAKYGVKDKDLMTFRDRFHGCDIDRFVGAVSAINMFMESHGAVFPNVAYRDSLHSDLPIPQYNVILANMPFGVKGLKFADCCERVKALKIDGTKSEPLFLQLMMVSLAPGGRCAVVVPDGMLVNTSKCHDGTRKYLLDHYEVKRVIKMKGQFFMNTGIQPSILFFENTGKPTTAVEFWDVEKSEKGEITETMVVSVPRAKMDASCSFDMRRYLEVKAVANPAGFPMVKLGDIAELCRNNTEIVDDVNGMYTKYFGPKIVGKCSNYHFNGEYILTPGRQSIGLLGYVNGKFTTTHTFVIKVKPEYISKYVYYYLLLNDKLSEKSKGIIPYIKNEDVLTLQVIVPPLDTQKEIVATLDRIYNPGTTELADTLKLTSQAMDLVLASPGGATLEPIVEAQRLIRKSAQMVADVKAQMVADVKAQMVAVVRASCASGEEKPISEIVKLKHGFPFKSSDYTTEGLIVVKHNNITDGYVSKSKKQDYIPSSAKTDDYKMVVGDIVISMDFDCGKVGKIVETGWVLNQRVCLARTSSENLYQEYLYWALRFGGFYEKMQTLHTGTTIKHISGKDIDKATIKLPSLALQAATLVRLSLLQSQLTALESLQNQTEDNARFILESYLTAAPIENIISHE